MKETGTEAGRDRELENQIDSTLIHRHLASLPHCGIKRQSLRLHIAKKHDIQVFKLNEHHP